MNHKQKRAKHRAASSPGRPRRTMMKKYRQWIAQCVPESPDDVRGRCMGFVGLMINTFPELRAASGTFGAEPHWWCVDPFGEIVDPTRHQFERDEGYHGTLRGRYTDTADGRIRVVA